MAKEKAGERPEWIHGTNQGRVEVKVRGPGEMAEGHGDKGKAQIAMGVPVKLACEQEEHEGGYRG